MIDMDDDLNEMLSEDDHGSVVLFKGRRFEGISNQEIIDTEYGTDEDDRERTVLYVRTKHVPDAAYGDAVTIGGKPLFIHGIQSDGTGQTALIVHEDNPKN